MSKTRYSQSEAAREINAISDQYALYRGAVAEAVKHDDYFGYVLECFLRNERDMETGRKVNKTYLIRKLKEFNRIASFQSSEREFMTKHNLVKQDTRMGNVYYESISADNERELPQDLEDLREDVVE